MLASQMALAHARGTLIEKKVATLQAGFLLGCFQDTRFARTDEPFRDQGRASQAAATEDAQAPRKRRIKELKSRDEPTFAAAMWQCTTRSLAWLKSKDAGFAPSLLQPFSNAQLLGESCNQTHRLATYEV
jgi:hypothetical protein